MHTIILNYIKLHINFQNYPWTILSQNGHGEVTHSDGIFFSMLDVLAKRLNFTYVVTPPNNGGADSAHYADAHDDMLNQLQNNDVFMAVTPFVITEELAKIVTFSDAIDLQQYTIMYRRPQELSRTTILIRPLSPLVSIFPINCYYLVTVYNLHNSFCRCDFTITFLLISVIGLDLRWGGYCFECSYFVDDSKIELHSEIF